MAYRRLYVFTEILSVMERLCAYRDIRRSRGYEVS
jgi:hypothetical protein